VIHKYAMVMNVQETETAESATEIQVLRKSGSPNIICVGLFSILPNPSEEIMVRLNGISQLRMVSDR
jgi:hypothetical protein